MRHINIVIALPSFKKTLAARDQRLTRLQPGVLQLNVGKLCNLTCVHCHVNAGPARKEIITRETIDRIMDWFSETEIPCVDLTGGTPEMIPDFRYLVERLRDLPMRRRIINRCNVTILLEPGFEWAAEFQAENEVEIVASMPCYSPENVNEQRGEGVFDKSIEALQLLNRLGYGKGNPKLPLHLVYNPNGAFLPGDQAELEADYKRELMEHFGISFDSLYALANLPVSRFSSYLKRQGQYESYLQLLIDNFNVASVEGLMCRDTLNVSWLGDVYDCDFNQMCGMAWKDGGETVKIWEVDVDEVIDRPILTADHCYGCTAGAGSSCGGALIENQEVNL